KDSLLLADARLVDIVAVTIRPRGRSSYVHNHRLPSPTSHGRRQLVAGFPKSVLDLKSKFSSLLSFCHIFLLWPIETVRALWCPLQPVGRSSPAIQWVR